MSDSEDDAVEKQLKIVIVGEAGCGKVKNLGPSLILRKAYVSCLYLIDLISRGLNLLIPFVYA
jgi:hypothetical protein